MPNQYNRFLATCATCGRTTSRAYARVNNGNCKSCVTGIPRVERETCSPKRRNGICEDAPCCGCCGPQGDGDYYGYAAMERAMEPYEGDF